jgi:hypothetical protein
MQSAVAKQGSAQMPPASSVHTVPEGQSPLLAQ